MSVAFNFRYIVNIFALDDPSVRVSRCRKCNHVLLTLLRAAISMRRRCSDVNGWGSQADPHVIKAKWNIKGEGSGDKNTWRNGASKSKRDAVWLKVRHGFTFCCCCCGFSTSGTTSNGILQVLSARRGGGIKLAEVYILFSTLITDSLPLHLYHHTFRIKDLKGWGF